MKDKFKEWAEEGFKLQKLWEGISKAFYDNSKVLREASQKMNKEGEHGEHGKTRG